MESRGEGTNVGASSFSGSHNPVFEFEMEVDASHPVVRSLETLCLHDDVRAPEGSGLELARFLKVKRVDPRGERFSAPPAMERLWRRMLLDAKLRDEVDQLVGGDVPYNARDESDEERVRGMVTSMYDMRKLGVPPTLPVWTQTGTLAENIRAVPVKSNGATCDEVYVCDGVTSPEFIRELLSTFWSATVRVRELAPSNAGNGERSASFSSSSGQAHTPHLGHTHSAHHGHHGHTGSAHAHLVHSSRPPTSDALGSERGDSRDE